MTVSISIVKALFARSGNLCAFPDCDQRLVSNDNLFVGQLCHIAASSPEGPRYDPAQTDDVRNDYPNLLLLCYPHHRRIDTDPVLYTVDWLREAKAKHEAKFETETYIVGAPIAQAIVREEEEYWLRLKVIQKRTAELCEYPMEIDLDAPHSAVVEKLGQIILNMENLAQSAAIPENIASKGPSQWEALNIFLPNSVMMSKLYLQQLNVQYLACRLRLTPDDVHLKASFEEAKAMLIHITTHSGYID